MLKLPPVSGALTIRDVLVLAASAQTDPETELRKVFDWVFERSLASMRASFGAAGATLLALAGAELKHEHVTTLQTIAVLGSAAVFAVLGLRRTLRLNALHREYLAAMGLLRLIGPLPPVYLLYL